MFALCSGCQQSVYQMQGNSLAGSQESASGAISVKDDQFSKYINYSTGLTKEGNLYDSTAWVLVANKDKKTNKKFYYIQWMNLYSSNGWRFYYRAANDDAVELKLDQVSRDVSSCGKYRGCTYDETYNIYLTDEMVKKAYDKGMSIKIYAKDSSSKIVTIPAFLVKSLLNRMKI